MGRERLGELENRVLRMERELHEKWAASPDVGDLQDDVGEEDAISREAGARPIRRRAAAWLHPAVGAAYAVCSTS